MYLYPKFICTSTDLVDEQIFFSIAKQLKMNRGSPLVLKINGIDDEIRIGPDDTAEQLATDFAVVRK